MHKQTEKGAFEGQCGSVAGEGREVKSWKGIPWRSRPEIIALRRGGR